MQDVKIAFIGFGNVGQALARLLLDKQKTLRDRHGIAWRVVGIATGRHGTALDSQGIELEKALDLAGRGVSLSRLSTVETPEDSLDFVRRCGADVLFENTPVNYQSGQPAIDHIRTALENGMHAITANKGPVVHAFDQLTVLAKEHGKRFFSYLKGGEVTIEASFPAGVIGTTLENLKTAAEGRVATKEH